MPTKMLQACLMLSLVFLFLYLSGETLSQATIELLCLKLTLVFASR